MKKLGMLFLFAMFSTIEVHAAEEAVVIEVRKNISMSKTDKIYKNFFINGGTNLGLAKGSTVDVVRRLPVHDPLRNSAIGDIRVKVGKLEIIHADPKISVARLVSNESPENRPILDYEAVMVGDRLDLGSVVAMAPPKVEKVAVAEIPAEKVAVAVVESKPSRGIASVSKKGHKKPVHKKKASKKRLKI